MDKFEKAYIKYDDIKQAKSSLPKSGKSIFSWKKKKFHHISVGSNKVDFLIYRGIVICSFPLKKDRNEIYSFIEKHWDSIIKPFTDYIDERQDNE